MTWSDDPRRKLAFQLSRLLITDRLDLPEYDARIIRNENGGFDVHYGGKGQLHGRSAEIVINHFLGEEEPMSTPLTTKQIAVLRDIATAQDAPMAGHYMTSVVNALRERQLIITKPDDSLRLTLDGEAVLKDAPPPSNDDPPARRAIYTHEASGNGSVLKTRPSLDEPEAHKQHRLASKANGHKTVTVKDAAGDRMPINPEPTGDIGTWIDPEYPPTNDCGCEQHRRFVEWLTQHNPTISSTFDHFVALEASAEKLKAL